MVHDSNREHEYRKKVLEIVWFDEKLRPKQGKYRIYFINIYLLFIFFNMKFNEKINYYYIYK